MKFFWVSKNTEKEDEITQQIHSKRNEFTAAMLKLKNESQEIHRDSTNALRESQRINKNIEDLASNIALIVSNK